MGRISGHSKHAWKMLLFFALYSREGSAYSVRSVIKVVCASSCCDKCSDDSLISVAQVRLGIVELDE